MVDPVLCPIAPELVDRLRQGIRTRGPARIWLDDANVLNVQELTDADLLAEILWGNHSTSTVSREAK